jgi:hypothetical protein
LDTFNYTTLGDNADFTDVFSVICLILVLSHINASVESGFSVNSDMLVENMSEQNKKASEKKSIADAIKVLEAKKVKLNETTAVETRKLN